jgi:hypothetical protein
LSKPLHAKDWRRKVARQGQWPRAIRAAKAVNAADDRRQPQADFGLG